MFAEKDRDNDGLMSFEEFTGQETKVEKAFRAMDRDGDGYVTKTEFQKVCKNLTKEQIQAAFNKFDKSGNGKLNYVEFCGMMNARKKNSAEQQSASSSGASTPAVSKS
jgi:Ca2+-binding EF-hand superfamily protein